MLEFIVTNGIPNSEKKCCEDCFYLRGAVSLWCKNKKACKEHGTNMPGWCDCKFWKPMRLFKELPWYERWFCKDEYILTDLEEE